MKKFATEDVIANEMFRLLKKAQDNTTEKMIHEADDGLVDVDYLLMDEVDDGADDVSYVDDQIKDMEARFANDNLMRANAGFEGDTKDHHLMQGLGKIEASLRRKGEGFAADLVRTTAMEIREDIVKGAAQKSYVLKNLVKMASDLDRRGENKAAAIVKLAVNKLNR